MKSIHRHVEALCEKYGTRDPYALCDALDIPVVICDLPLSIRGFYQYMNRTRLIYLNQHLSESSRRITLAHELGHAVLHRKLGNLFVDGQDGGVFARLEREADIFSLSLLQGEHLGEISVSGTELSNLAAASHLYKTLNRELDLRSPVVRYEYRRA